MLSFTVYGKAQPAGSKRAFVNKKTGRAQVVDANAKSKPWKEQVAQAAGEAMIQQGVGGFPEGPLSLHVIVYVQRPRGHYKVDGSLSAAGVRASYYPVTRPDLTKLLRGIEDALTGIVWKDDAQVVFQVASKRYGDAARAQITVERVE
jgi:Holliday junction resolvase RusA-like endonuclease